MSWLYCAAFAPSRQALFLFLTDRRGYCFAPFAGIICGMNKIAEFLETANLKALARQTGLARSTLQRIKYGRTERVSPGTRRLLLDAMLQQQK